ncbi:hypothetical protein FGAF374_03790 [Escherichia coli]|uniref:Uncharacterized protein n=1 Tax=Escherichia coli TaxID=562 RepID=A0AAD2GH83_ECOLX|nr:hypothetical protein ExPECSC048_03911 [Escherichia coli]CAK0668260.1 hypothetical protein FGAF374_03790 [Escherichia coli]CAK1209869.1 hypothetical protein FGAF848_19220 [Escherichia coli]SRB28985.1 Uncharacterised protein [Escherichia coli]STQ50266.1 Uncharacterised protein [Escherichia coli]
MVLLWMTVLCSGTLHFLLLIWDVLGGEALTFMAGVHPFIMVSHGGWLGLVSMMWPEAFFMPLQSLLYS